MRNWNNHEIYLNELTEDIYPQPEAKDLHGALAKKVIDLWMSRLPDCKSVLDLGCGEALCQDLFQKWHASYEGVCLGEDYIVARDKGRNVKPMDFSFLEYPDDSFDLLFSRHSLEHSPMPLLTLMEWNRVSKQWLGLVVPAPEWYGVTGRNHYYVLYQNQWENLLENAGWKVIWRDVDALPIEEGSSVTRPHEYWLFCEKRKNEPV